MCRSRNCYDVDYLYTETEILDAVILDRISGGEDLEVSMKEHVKIASGISGGKPPLPGIEFV